MDEILIPHYRVTAINIKKFVLKQKILACMITSVTAFPAIAEDNTEQPATYIGSYQSYFSDEYDTPQENIGQPTKRGAIVHPPLVDGQKSLWADYLPQ